MKYPFEAKPDEVLAHPEQYVDSIFSSLASEFLIMPKGEGFLEYSAFASGYEALKGATSGFKQFSPSKATRINHLCEMSAERVRNRKPPYQVVACLAGRGFGVRREDMRKMIANTRGKVFTPKTLDRLVDCTDLIRFRTTNNSFPESKK